MKKTLLFFFLGYLTFQLSAQHTIVLKTGQKVNGVVMSINNDVLNAMIDGDSKDYSLKDISSIFFNEYVPYDGVFVPQDKEKQLLVDGFTVKYNIKGRVLIQNPTISIGTEDKGAVVVAIVVDRYGNVISANPGAPGSTTSSNYLYVKAKAAAQTAKFDEDPKGPLKTEGTITIIY